MGLLDVLNGMAHGPRGTPDPAAPGSGMSKTTMALLAPLGCEAFKSLTSQAQAPAPQSPREDRDYHGADERYARDQRYDRDDPDGRSAPRGGLGDILRDIFGRGSVPGPVLRRGLDNTVRDLEHSGHGDIAHSWVGRGENLPITPRQLEAALGEPAIGGMIEQTGMERNELLETLSRYLPRIIDHLTPQGTLPSDEQPARMG
jgi:uncharacterized protein YidB (DUF937 family)